MNTEAALNYAMAICYFGILCTKLDSFYSYMRCRDGQGDGRLLLLRLVLIFKLLRHLTERAS